MFLVAPDGRRITEVIHERVEVLCCENGYADDAEALLEVVLADAEIVLLLDVVCDDESGKRLVDSIIADIRRQIQEDLRQKQKDRSMRVGEA